MYIFATNNTITQQHGMARIRSAAMLDIAANRFIIKQLNSQRKFKRLATVKKYANDILHGLSTAAPNSEFMSSWANNN